MTVMPVIELSQAHEHGRDRKGVASHIARACEDVGFFMVTGHGVTTETIDRVRAQARRFFAEPLEVKERCLLDPADYRGYSPLAGQSFYRLRRAG